VREVVGLMRTPIGNLQSVYNALYENGCDPVWVDASTSSFDDLTHLIVPGVGHFGAVMHYLNTSGLSSRIQDFAKSARPLLGICVGMQILATVGMEGEETLGLGLVEGTVERLSHDAQVRLPHVGWNTVDLTRDHPILAGVKRGRDFYFVHSYGMTVKNPEDSLGETDYGKLFTAIVARKNVVGLQFHPEKSQANGLKLLENFCRWDGTC
jgi:glutamine amidotransferase